MPTTSGGSRKRANSPDSGDLNHSAIIRLLSSLAPAEGSPLWRAIDTETNRRLFPNAPWPSRQQVTQPEPQWYDGIVYDPRAGVAPVNPAPASAYMPQGSLAGRPKRQQQRPFGDVDVEGGLAGTPLSAKRDAKAGPIGREMPQSGKEYPSTGPSAAPMTGEGMSTTMKILLGLGGLGAVAALLKGAKDGKLVQPGGRPLNWGAGIGAAAGSLGQSMEKNAALKRESDERARAIAATRAEKEADRKASREDRAADRQTEWDMRVDLLNREYAAKMQQAVNGNAGDDEMRTLQAAKLKLDIADRMRELSRGDVADWPEDARVAYDRLALMKSRGDEALKDKSDDDLRQMALDDAYNRQFLYQMTRIGAGAAGAFQSDLMGAANPAYGASPLRQHLNVILGEYRPPDPTGMSEAYRAMSGVGQMP